MKECTLNEWQEALTLAITPIVSFSVTAYVIPPARPDPILHFAGGCVIFIGARHEKSPHCGEVITLGISPKHTRQASVKLWLRKLRAGVRLLRVRMFFILRIIKSLFPNRTFWYGLKMMIYCLFSFSSTLCFTVAHVHTLAGWVWEGATLPGGGLLGSVSWHVEILRLKPPNLFLVDYPHCFLSPSPWHECKMRSIGNDSLDYWTLQWPKLRRGLSVTISVHQLRRASEYRLM